VRWTCAEAGTPAPRIELVDPKLLDEWIAAGPMNR
jgi:hypothetical protein